MKRERPALPEPMCIDFDRHNNEVREVWEAYRAGRPIRVPMILGINVRYTLLNPELNPRRITFREYFSDPDLMARVQLEHQNWVRHSLAQDAEMGLPGDGWRIHVDFQNCYEAAWFGCELRFYDDQVPDTRPILSNDQKRILLDRGIPDPLADGIMKTAMRFYEHMDSRKEQYVLAGKAVISVTPAGLGTDGPLTVSCNLRGATEMLSDLYEDPDFARELLAYVTEATIVRIRRLREVFGHERRPERWGFADDSIALISEEQYREFVLPCHKRLITELAGPGPHSIHLCGDATRHFRTLKDELNIQAFDTGYPVDFRQLRKELGPEVEILGGPAVGFLKSRSPAEIEEECRRILSSGIMDGGKFILREGNNLSPCTPPRNTNAMYAAVKKYGVYANGKVS